MTRTFGPYTPLRWIGDTGYVSGQVGVDPASGTAAADVGSQTRQCLANLAAVLAAEDVTPEQVVKTTVYLRYMDDFAAVNDIYQAFFQPPRPARSCVAVASLPKIADNELLVEIEAIVCRTAPPSI